MGRARAAVTFHNYPSAWHTALATAPNARLSAVSRALAGAAGERLGAPVDVVPIPIDPAFVHSAPSAEDRGEDRTGPPGPVRDPTVLFPSRLMRKKGVLDLLAVAARPELAGVRFAFTDLISPWLRPTAEHRELRAAVAGRPNAVLLAPALSPAEMAGRYRRVGVVVCPVREPEGLGLVALEAQACGAPLVTTDLVRDPARPCSRPTSPCPPGTSTPSPPPSGRRWTANPIPGRGPR